MFLRRSSGHLNPKRRESKPRLLTYARHRKETWRTNLNIQMIGGLRGKSEQQVQGRHASRVEHALRQVVGRVAFALTIRRMLHETFGHRKGWLWFAVQSSPRSGSSPGVSGTPVRSSLGTYGREIEPGTLWVPSYPHGVGRSTRCPSVNIIVK